MSAILWIALSVLNVHAADLIWDVQNHRGMSVEEFTQTRGPGSILVLGEKHATTQNQNDQANIQHHANQVRLLKAISQNAEKSGQHLSVGMEFLKYPYQDLTDQYVNGTLREDLFLKQVNWGSAPFQFYREQIQMPRLSGGRTLALNAPAAISRQVARGGRGSLTPEQQKWLPPLWERGSAAYFERFQEAMGQGHIPSAQMENYFWAQSLWDDTMGWNVVKHLNADPLAIQVVLVGEFHVEFNHGLPTRLLAQGAPSVQSLLQIEAADLSDAEIQRVSAPDPRYGNRADYLWIQTAP